MKMASPQFPLGDYPPPVHKMAIRSMKPNELLRYSISSPKAARAVTQANVKFPYVAFKFKGTEEKFWIKVRVGTDELLIFRWTFFKNWSEWDTQSKCTAHFANGEIMEESYQNENAYGCQMTDENAERIVGIVVKHLMNVFSSDNTSFEIWPAHWMPLIISSIPRGHPVPQLRLRWIFTTEELRSILECVRNTKRIEIDNGFQFLTREHLLILNVSRILIEDGDAWMFQLIINKWASGEAFQNLEAFALITHNRSFEDFDYDAGIQTGHFRSSPSQEMSIEEKTVYDGIELKKWDASRMPGYLYRSSNNGYGIFPLSNSPIVVRADGKTGSISRVSPDMFMLDVWNEEDRVPRVEEHKALLRGFLKEYKRKVDADKAIIEETNSKIENLGRELEELETKNRHLKGKVVENEEEKKQSIEETNSKIENLKRELEDLKTMKDDLGWRVEKNEREKTKAVFDLEHIDEWAN